MKIRRSRLTGDFLQVPNATVRDDRLSHMARGILVELLSRPDGWEATADDMWRASVAKHGKASPGRRAFRAAFAELKEHGYLTSERTTLPGNKFGTTLAITDIPAGGTGVPHAGTSARPATTDVSPAQTDVPHAGTSETRTDVPHGGTPSYENGENTGEKTTSSSAAPQQHENEDEDLTAFGAFWIVYPKSRDRQKTLAAWREARAKGVPAQQMIDAAQGYARERAGEAERFTKLSANWLREERYEDDYTPAPTPANRPPLRAVSGGWQPYREPTPEDRAADLGHF